MGVTVAYHFKSHPGHAVQVCGAQHESPQPGTYLPADRRATWAHGTHAGDAYVPVYVETLIMSITAVKVHTVRCIDESPTVPQHIA